MTINNHNFYSLINNDGVTGVKKQCGYRIESDDITLYIYERFYESKFYFIDPDTGLSLHEEENVADIYDIKDNLDNIVAICREKLKKAKKLKEYRLRVEIFEKYKEARLFEEECKIAVHNFRRKESI